MPGISCRFLMVCKAGSSFWSEKVYVIQYSPFIVFILLMLSACTVDIESSFIGRWSMERIEYSDGSHTVPEGNNAVTFSDSHIIEHIDGHGNRRYSYSRSEEVLTVMDDTSEMEWVILNQGQDHMEIETPIGVYVLSRQGRWH